MRNKTILEKDVKKGNKGDVLKVLGESKNTLVCKAANGEILPLNKQDFPNTDYLERSNFTKVNAQYSEFGYHKVTGMFITHRELPKTEFKIGVGIEIIVDSENKSISIVPTTEETSKDKVCASPVHKRRGMTVPVIHIKPSIIKEILGEEKGMGYRRRLLITVKNYEILIELVSVDSCKYQDYERKRRGINSSSAKYCTPIQKF